jgi:hypothetical protein
MPGLAAVGSLAQGSRGTATGTVPSQKEYGTINGHVTDPARAALQGARVELQPTGLTAVSDSQGQFIVPGVRPGNYTVSVSYIGFAPFSTAIRVTPGQETQINALLQVGSVNQEVVVRGEREAGEIEALNIERTADNIVEVLPTEVITSLPNTNVADALGRLPGVSLERDEGEGKYVQIRGTEPRLSNVTINGVHVSSPERDVRNVKLDVIPASLVDSIQVSKTLSANQDGDAIGGSIDLVTTSLSTRSPDSTVTPPLLTVDLRPSTTAPSASDSGRRSASVLPSGAVTTTTAEATTTSNPLRAPTISRTVTARSRCTSAFIYVNICSAGTAMVLLAAVTIA